MPDPSTEHLDPYLDLIASTRRDPGSGMILPGEEEEDPAMATTHQHARIGRLVHYCLTEYDAAAIEHRRERVLHAQHDLQDPAGHELRLHAGSTVNAGDVFPMIITKIIGTDPEPVVNGQLILDGDDGHWIVSVSPGHGPGRFLWTTIE
jgi:hypothetical protein